jgi:sorbitol-specific phosphotransferase system component IIC
VLLVVLPVFPVLLVVLPVFPMLLVVLPVFPVLLVVADEQAETAAKHPARSRITPIRVMPCRRTRLVVCLCNASSPGSFVAKS